MGKGRIDLDAMFAVHHPVTVIPQARKLFAPPSDGNGNATVCVCLEAQVVVSCCDAEDKSTRRRAAATRAAYSRCHNPYRRCPSATDFGGCLGSYAARAWWPGYAAAILLPPGNRCQECAQRRPLAVVHHHPLRVLVPLGWADPVAFFLAGVKRPSNLPNAVCSARSHRHTCISIRCTPHLSNRRRPVPYFHPFAVKEPALNV